MFNFFSGFSLRGIMVGMFWIILFILILAFAGIMIYLIWRMKNSVRIYEVNPFNLTIRRYWAFWNRKLGKNLLKSKKFGYDLPPVKEEYFLHQGKVKALILVRANDGTLHPVKILTKQDLDNLNKADLYKIFLAPSEVHADLNWLADKCEEANKEYKFTHWWQSPTVMVIATAFICMIMFFGTMILAKKL